MPPKVDTSQLVILRTFLFSGDKGLPVAMTQKLGPLGVNAKKVGEDVAKACEPFKGLRVFVEIHCQDRNANIKVCPGISALIIKEMGGSVARDRKKEKLPNRSGNITFEQVMKIARTLHETKSQAKTFEGSITQVLGTCLSCGCKVDGQSPKDITLKVKNKELKCE